MKCSVKACKVNHMADLAIVDDKQKLMLLCPEHLRDYALSGFQNVDLETYPSQCGVGEECELCITEALFYADEIELHLCEKHLKKLIRQNLSTLEYKILLERHGDFKLIADNFYARGGYALQPL